MENEKSLNGMLRVIVENLSPLIPTETIDSQKVWSVWIQPLGGKRGLRITADSPNPYGIPNGFSLIITRTRGWRFWERAVSRIYIQEISEDQFVREFKTLARKNAKCEVQYFDEKEEGAWPCPGTLNLAIAGNSL